MSEVLGSTDDFNPVANTDNAIDNAVQDTATTDTQQTAADTQTQQDTQQQTQQTQQTQQQAAQTQTQQPQLTPEQVQSLYQFYQQAYPIIERLNSLPPEQRTQIAQMLTPEQQAAMQQGYQQQAQYGQTPAQGQVQIPEELKVVTDTFPEMKPIVEGYFTLQNTVQTLSNRLMQAENLVVNVQTMLFRKEFDSQIDKLKQEYPILTDQDIEIISQMGLAQARANPNFVPNLYEIGKSLLAKVEEIANKKTQQTNIQQAQAQQQTGQMQQAAPQQDSGGEEGDIDPIVKEAMRKAGIIA